MTRFPVEFDPVEAVPGMPQAQAPAQLEPMMGDPTQSFMVKQEMQDGAAEDMLKQQLQASVDFGQPHPAAVDMEA